MTPAEPTVRVTEVVGEEKLLGAVRGLFRAYSIEYDAALAESLALQGFETELAGLPGRYAPPSGCLLLAMAGGVPAGCVAVRSLGGAACEMKRLYVARERRGRGVGRLLVAAVVRRAERAGHRRMVLDTLPEMAGALALYRSFGFVETDPYWDCPIARTTFMERFLSPPGVKARPRDGSRLGGGFGPW